MPQTGWNTKYKMNAADLGKQMVEEAKEKMKQQELQKKQLEENKMKEKDGNPQLTENVMLEMYGDDAPNIKKRPRSTGSIDSMDTSPPTPSPKRVKRGDSPTAQLKRWIEDGEHESEEEEEEEYAHNGMSKEEKEKHLCHACGYTQHDLKNLAYYEDEYGGTQYCKPCDKVINPHLYKDLKSNMAKFTVKTTKLTSLKTVV